MKYHLLPILALLSCLHPIPSDAQNLVRIGKEHGLGNSFILSLCQDTEGLIWLGTADGLKVLYNQEIHVAHPDLELGFSNMAIGHIIETPGGGIWVQTASGMIRIGLCDGSVTRYDQFTGNYLIRGVTGEDDVVVLDRTGALFIYRDESDSFENILLTAQADNRIDNIGFDETYFWTSGPNGLIRYKWLTENGRKIGLGLADLIDSAPVRHCNMSLGGLYMVDDGGILSRMDIDKVAKDPLMDLSADIRERGDVTAIVNNGEELFVSFSGKGVLRFLRTSSGWDRYDLGIHAGVLAMKRDRLQNILWIASNGQGLYKYWNGEYTVRSFHTVDYAPSFTNPVTAVFPDGSDRLWVGTKGSGILCLQRITGPDIASYRVIAVYSNRNSSLLSNDVWCFEPDGEGGLWIGTEGGINYFQTRTGALEIFHDGIRAVRHITRTGGRKLLAGTAGYGVYELGYSQQNNRMITTGIRSFSVDGGVFSSNMFTSVTVDSGTGNIWLGNSALGLFRMDTDGLRPIGLEGWPSSRKDILSLCSDQGKLWIGTGVGVVERDDEGSFTLLNTDDGLANSMVHALVLDGKGKTWASTNDGIALLDARPSVTGSMGYLEGLEITEFSDGAAARRDSTMFFGGVGGWVEITTEKRPTRNSFVPPFYIATVTSRTRTTPVYLWAKEDNHVIPLRHDRNSFGVTFAALDNLNQSSIRYRYRLSRNGRWSEWVDNGSSPSVFFSRLTPGRYTLTAQCYYFFSDIMSEPASLRFNIAPPWYQSRAFLGFLGLLSACLLVWLIRTLKRRDQRKHERQIRELRVQHEEELYKEKLQFFSNITHEFFTPLTLIYGPCERLLQYDGADSYVRKYAGLIKNNTSRLNTLIRDIIEYSKLERKEYRLNVRHVDLSTIGAEIFSAFSEPAARAGIHYGMEAPPSLMWNMDPDCFGTILSNLLSNAVKYTPTGGRIRFTMTAEGDNVSFKVYNTGKGISRADLETLFDDDRILDRIEDKASKGIMEQHGLGLAICRDMVILLGGSIEADGRENEYAEFTVRLPRLEDAPEAEASFAYSHGSGIPEMQEDILVNADVTDRIPPVPSASGAPRADILVVEDNPEMLYLISESLNAFRLTSCTSADEAMERLRKNVPDLIVTDIMMEGTDGFAFTKMVKANKHTMEIPVVIISAKTATEDRIEGFRAGCDAYIGKPFDIGFLCTVIDRLLLRRAQTREYYSTSASAFTYLDGKLTDKSDVDFIAAVDAYIKEHLQDSLTIQDMAMALNLSDRSLYRRFSEIGLPTPKEYINRFKLENVTRLLMTTSLTVKEIMYECGFSNKAHFHREFLKRYGMTPLAWRKAHKTPDTSLNKL